MLKKVMGKVISDFQHAFKDGRQLLEATLIANKYMNLRLQSSTSRVICILDIKKAYDHVN